MNNICANCGHEKKWHEKIYRKGCWYMNEVCPCSSFTPSEVAGEKETIKASLKEYLFEELVNIVAEMAIGNNEGRWGDRIWTQEILERLKRLKNEE